MSTSSIGSGAGGGSSCGVGIGKAGRVGIKGERGCCSLALIWDDFNLALRCHSDIGTNDAFLSMTEANESSTWQWN
jgi:hypothetical protein